MRKQRTYTDPITGEVYQGYHARDLARDLAVLLWQKVRTPLLLLFTLAALCFFVWAVLYA